MVANRRKFAAKLLSRFQNGGFRWNGNGSAVNRQRDISHEKSFGALEWWRNRIGKHYWNKRSF
jgi:hypothetical protein